MIIYTILKMATHLETWSKEEIRAVIRFLNAKGLNPTDIHKDLQSVYGEHVISRTQVYHWCSLFQTGHSELKDSAGRGRSSSATSEDKVKRADELIRQDRRLKLHEIASSLEISETSAHRIVFDELGYRKVSARWVPKQLTDNHKEQRLDICRKLLTRSKGTPRAHEHTVNAAGDFTAYDEAFLDSIVTGDETWLHHCTPETKQDSMTWKHPSSPVAKKFKVMPSARKIMGTVFWDSRGVLLFETLQPGDTVNAARYCQTLNKLREAIRRKRPGQLTNGVILQHDNATPHTARQTQSWIEKYGWEILPHPPHSPDLAPSDFHLFGPLKRELAGKRFDDNDELVDHVRQWLQSLDGSFFREGIYSMVRRWQKCVDRLGCYVEK